jgi:16S rRNA (uracil1498-N3)-methyltransferase
MKRHYFIGQFNWSDQVIECLNTEIIHQIKDVLKIKIGEEVVLGDGLGRAAVATLKQINKKSLDFSIVTILPTKKDDKRVILYAALLKRDNFEWLLQKAVEVGVDEIVPLVSERTVKIGFNEKRWQKIIKEASEQSQRHIVPILRSVQNFKEVLKIAKGEVWFFDPAGDHLDKVRIKDKCISIFIGPEGGWSENEIQMAKDQKVKLINLGDNILRGETAGIVATYLAKNIF